jgi:L-ascorbate metabolism protein UlaG (beta-lactamase superfamily)
MNKRSASWLVMALALGSLPAASASVQLKYLGTAGWEVSDGTTVVLIDPYCRGISEQAIVGLSRRYRIWRLSLPHRFGVEDIRLQPTQVAFAIVTEPKTA